jgi:hypothetical protein
MCFDFDFLLSTKNIYKLPEWNAIKCKITLFYLSRKRKYFRVCPSKKFTLDRIKKGKSDVASENSRGAIAT